MTVFCSKSPDFCRSCANLILVSPIFMGFTRDHLQNGCRRDWIYSLNCDDRGLALRERIHPVPGPPKDGPYSLNILEEGAVGEEFAPHGQGVGQPLVPAI